MARDIKDEIGAKFKDVPEGVLTLLNVAWIASQMGDGVAQAFSGVHRDAGPMPPAVDAGVRNVMITSLLFQTASERLADVLADSGYVDWAEVSRDPQDRLQTPSNPGEAYEKQDPAGEVLDGLRHMPVQQVPVPELAMNSIVRWAQSAPGDDFAMLIGMGPAKAVDAVRVAEGAMAVLEVSIRRALEGVRELYPAVALTPYGEALDGLERALGEMGRVREDVRATYATLKDAPGTETWEHLQRTKGMPSGTVGRP